MSGGTEQLAQIKSALEDTALDWRGHATKLSGLRRKAAVKLGRAGHGYLGSISDVEVPV